MSSMYLHCFRIMSSRKSLTHPANDKHSDFTKNLRPVNAKGNGGPSGTRNKSVEPVFVVMADSREVYWWIGCNNYIKLSWQNNNGWRLFSGVLLKMSPHFHSKHPWAPLNRIQERIFFRNAVGLEVTGPIWSVNTDSWSLCKQLEPK